jgi:DNA-directed RNA polymerase specialized sigma24 family protein
MARDEATKEIRVLSRRLVMKRTNGSQRGRLREIERIYATRYRDFLRVAHAEAGDADAARNVVHEAFVSVVQDGVGRSANGLEPELWRAVLQRASARPRERLFLVANDPSAARTAHVRAATAALPAHERHALYLRQFGGLADRTVAVVLGLEPGDVPSVVAAGRQAVAAALGDGCEEVHDERQAV